MKKFDFPVVFRYIVGSLQIDHQTVQKQKLKVKQHIPLPNNFPSHQFYHEHPINNIHPLNQPKQYSFGKKKLIAIKYLPDQSNLRNTHITSQTDRKSTCLEQLNLKKLQSHQNRVQNTRKPDHRLQNFQSLRSSQTTNKNKNLSSNLNKDSTIKKQFKNKTVKFSVNKQLRKTQGNQNHISILPSKKSLNKEQSWKLLSSKRNVERHKTQLEQADQNPTNKRSQIKKVTNFVLRKPKGKNLTKFYHTQKQQEDKENNSLEIMNNDFKSKRSINSKKPTFLGLSDGKSNDGNKYSMKKITSKKSIGKSKKYITSQKYLQFDKTDFIKRVLSSNIDEQESKDNHQYSRQIETGSQKLISPQVQEVKIFIRRTYRLKSEKIFKKNSSIIKIKQSLHHQKMQQNQNLLNKHLGTQYGHHFRKMERIDTSKFKKKQQDISGNQLGNTKLIRRIRRQSDQQQFIDGENQYEKGMSKNVQKKTVLFSKSNGYSNQNRENFNVFSQLNRFHTLINAGEPIVQDDRFSQVVSGSQNVNNQFKLISENQNRRSEKLQFERKQMFKFDDKLFQFQRKIVNKSNLLKQIQVL